MKVVFGKIFSPEKRYSRMIIEDGRIIALDNERSAPENAEILHIPDNKCLLPPLVDCHVHFFQTGLYMKALNLSNISAKSELLSTLRREPLDKYRIGELVVAYGFDPIDEMPNAFELQSASPDIPIFLLRADGHSVSLSPEAMAMLPDHLRTGDGIYRGGSVKAVVEFFLASIPEYELVDAANRVSLAAFNAGALTVHALVPFIHWAELLLRIAPQLPVRLEIFLETMNVDAAEALGLSQIGGCIMLDGSFGSHTAALIEPYSDDSANRGCLYLSDDDIEKFMSRALSRNIAIAMHAIGDRAIEQYLRIAEKVAGGNILKRWRIEHCELVHPWQLEKISQLGITLSVQPKFENIWGGPQNLYAQRLGERWKSTNPFRTELEMGIRLLGGSDAYITPINPVDSIVSAMNHPNQEQKIGFFEAMQLFSSNVHEWSGNEGSEFKLGEEFCGVLVDGDFSDEKTTSVEKIVTEGNI